MYILANKLEYNTKKRCTIVNVGLELPVKNMSLYKPDISFAPGEARGRYRNPSRKKRLFQIFKNSPSEKKFFSNVPRRTPVQPCTREASLASRVQSAPVLLRWSSK